MLNTQLHGGDATRHVGAQPRPLDVLSPFLSQNYFGFSSISVNGSSLVKLLTAERLQSVRTGAVQATAVNFERNNNRFNFSMWGVLEIF